VLRLIQFGRCSVCKTPTYLPTYAAPGPAPKPIKVCACKPTSSKRRKEFEKELRVCHANATITGDDASEVLLLMGMVLGRAQGAVLSGDRKLLREKLLQLAALSWKLGGDI
jgi:hypothetical protein